MCNGFLGGQTPSLQMSPPSYFASAVIAEHDAMWRGMSLWFVRASFWLCLLPAPCAPPTTSLSGQHEELNSPWLCVSTALQQLKYWCAINTIFIKNQNTASYKPLRQKLTLSSVSAKTSTNILHWL